jgi:hypothetical protein
MITSLDVAPTRDIRLLRNHVFTSFTRFLSDRIIADANRCAERLLTALPQETLQENRVFVAYGGGKDSSYMVAFVRLIQLLLFNKCDTTFQLIIATNRHIGMPFSVMENIDRTYQALAAYDDPNVELLLIDGENVSPFDLYQPRRAEEIAKNRLDILMTGHRCEGNARPTFCNACNLSMVNSFGIAAQHGDGIDMVITGDSRKEQRAYVAWVNHIAAKFGLPRQINQQSFHSFLQTMSGIAHYYFQDIYGTQDEQQQHIRLAGLMRDPVFFSIYQDTDYKAEEHWELLTDFLGFQFDELAFSFTESDCANPALMAHLRGLKAEHLYERTYAAGVTEYTHFAVGLMHKKDFPLHLIEVMQARYTTPATIQTMRTKLNAHAQATLDLSQEQLVCMLYSPFVERGQNLAPYLQKEQPALYEQIVAIHRLLSQPASQVETPEQLVLAQRLTAISHLDLKYLRTLYTLKFSHYAKNGDENPISTILRGDPHKATIQTTHSAHGPVVAEVLSGR